MVLHFGDAAGIARRTEVVVDVVGHAGDGNVFGSRRLFSECDGIRRYVGDFGARRNSCVSLRRVQTSDIAKGFYCHGMKCVGLVQLDCLNKVIPERENARGSAVADDNFFYSRAGA